MTQFGVTNSLVKRIKYHRRNGFTIVNNSEFLFFPSGRDALNLETLIKHTLTKKCVPCIKKDTLVSDKFPGYIESFREELLPAKSLRELLHELEITPLVNNSEWVSCRST